MLASSGAIFTGDLEGAAALLEELSGVTGPGAGAWVRAHGLIAEAQVALLRGDLEASARTLDTAEALARNGAGPFALATARNMQATLALLAGDDDVALLCVAEAVRIAAEVGTAWTLVYSLPALATLAAKRALPELAAELFAAGAATAEATLVAVAFRPDLDAAEAHLGAVREQLTDAEFDRAWARGRELRIDEVIDRIDEISAPAPS